MEDRDPELDNEILTEDDIEVEVVDERPVEDRKEPFVADDDSDDEEPTDEELAAVSRRVQKRIGKLTAKYNDQRRTAEAAVKMQEEAIRFAEQQQGENQLLRRTMQEGEGMLLEEVRYRNKSDVAHAKAALSAAYDEGDSGKITEAQAQLNRAQIEEHRAEIYQPVQTLAPAEPVANIRQHNQQFDQNLAAWKVRNPWFDTDQTKHDIAMRIHGELEKSANSTGITVGSVEYYNQIDSAMVSTLQRLSGTEGKSEPAASPAPSVVAPTSRNASAPGTKSLRRVQLTETEANLAKRLNLTPAQYAIEKIKEENRIA